MPPPLRKYVAVMYKANNELVGLCVMDARSLSGFDNKYDTNNCCNESIRVTRAKLRAETVMRLLSAWKVQVLSSTHGKSKA